MSLENAVSSVQSSEETAPVQHGKGATKKGATKKGATTPTEVIPASKRKGSLVIADGQDVVLFKGSNDPNDPLRLLAVRTGKDTQTMTMLSCEASPKGADFLADILTDPTASAADKEGALFMLRKSMMSPGQFRGLIRAIDNGSIASLARLRGDVRGASVREAGATISFGVVALPKQLR